MHLLQLSEGLFIILRCILRRLDLFEKLIDILLNFRDNLLFQQFGQLFRINAHTHFLNTKYKIYCNVVRYNRAMNTPHIYAVIIGTEILNGRRQDKHFAFLQRALEKRGYELYASLVIKDETPLVEQTFTLVRSDPDGVLFSFGGIGSTPDDLTREIAAKVFTGQPVIRHRRFEQDIIERFGEEAYPHRIHMADLPEGSQLLFNPVNNMSGFFLDQRYFFVPGFPEMSHPMIEEALDRFYPKARSKFRKTLMAETSENSLIDLMQRVPPSIELSSLPMFIDGIPNVEISVASENEAATETWFKQFIEVLQDRAIAYHLL